jgi:hypothetical protein
LYCGEPHGFGTNLVVKRAGEARGGDPQCFGTMHVTELLFAISSRLRATVSSTAFCDIVNVPSSSDDDRWCNREVGIRFRIGHICRASNVHVVDTRHDKQSGRVTVATCNQERKRRRKQQQQQRSTSKVSHLVGFSRKLEWHRCSCLTVSVKRLP